MPPGDSAEAEGMEVFDPPNFHEFPASLESLEVKYQFFCGGISWNHFPRHLKKSESVTRNILQGCVSGTTMNPRVETPWAHGHGSWKRGLDRTRVRDDQKTSINGLSHEFFQSPAGKLNSSAGRLNSSYFPRLSRVSEQSSCHNSIIVMKWFAISYSLLIMLLTDVQDYFEMDHSWYILGTV